MAAHAMINEVLVAFDPFNKLLKLKNAQEYGKLFYSAWGQRRRWGRDKGVCHINCTIYKQFFLLLLLLLLPAPVAGVVATVVAVVVVVGIRVNLKVATAPR